MADRSIYSRGGSGMTRGGLDRYLGPAAGDYSSLPDHPDEAELAEPTVPVDCENADKDEAVCQIAAAEKELNSSPPPPESSAPSSAG